MTRRPSKLDEAPCPIETEREEKEEDSCGVEFTRANDNNGGELAMVLMEKA